MPGIFRKCYEMGANCWITEAIGLEEFIKIVGTVQDFWFTGGEASYFNGRAFRSRNK